MDNGLVTLGVGILSFIGIVFSLYRQRKDAEANTLQLNKLQQEINRSNRLHDHTVQRLQRARDALIKIQTEFTFITTSTGRLLKSLNKGGAADTLLMTELNRVNLIEKQAEATAAVTELGGIALALKDSQLMEEVTTLGLVITDTTTDTDINLKDITKICTAIHKLISELLEKEATKD